MDFICKTCGKTFRSIKACRTRIPKYCSKQCYYISRKGKRNKSKTKFKKGHTPWNKGKQCPETSNNNNGNWKDNDAGMRAMHGWVSRRKGKATTCEHCGFTSDNPKKLHWANKDHSYKRVLADYISLCVSCHRIYDHKDR